MDEKTKETIEKEPEKAPAEDTDEGSEPKADEVIKQADSILERIAKVEEKQARAEIGGEAETGQKKEKPKEMTSEEYAEAFRDGKIENPFKEK